MDTTVSTGETIVLSATVGGTANLYQWYKDGIPIGANDSLYTINSVVFADSGEYTCGITNTIVTGLTLNKRPIQLNVELFKLLRVLADRVEARRNIFSGYVERLGDLPGLALSLAVVVAFAAAMFLLSVHVARQRAPGLTTV